MFFYLITDYSLNINSHDKSRINGQKTEVRPFIERIFGHYLLQRTVYTSVSFIENTIEP